MLLLSCSAACRRPACGQHCAAAAGRQGSPRQDSSRLDQALCTGLSSSSGYRASSAAAPHVMAACNRHDVVEDGPILETIDCCGCCGVQLASSMRSYSLGRKPGVVAVGSAGRPCRGTARADMALCWLMCSNSQVSGVRCAWGAEL